MFYKLYILSPQTNVIHNVHTLYGKMYTDKNISLAISFHLSLLDTHNRAQCELE